jgi:hypothetical protein
MINPLTKISTKLLFSFAFLYLCIACGQNKNESKVVGNQGDNNTIQYFLDSAMFVLNQKKSLQNTSYHHGIVQVDIISQHYDTFAFISIHGEAIENDSIVFPNSLYIAYFHIDKWVLKDSILLDEMSMYLPDTIRKEDINFDNQTDFVLVYDIKSASRMVNSYELLLFNPQKNISKLRLYSTDTISILPKTKTIITWKDGGNFGTHEKNAYCWNNDTLQEIRRLEKSISMNKQGKIIGYDMTEYVLQNNKLVTKHEWLEKIETDYFEKWQ